MVSALPLPFRPLVKFPKLSSTRPLFLLAAAALGWTLWMWPRTGRPLRSPDSPEGALRASVSQQASDPRPHLALITFLLDQRRLHDALDEARIAHQRFPEAIAVTEALAEANYETGRIAEALQLLKAISRHQPRLRTTLATYLARSGRSNEAVQALAGATYGSGEERLAAAQVYLDALQPEKAEAVLSPAASKSPHNLDYQVTYGLALLSAGRYARAVEVLRPAAERAPGLASVHYYLGSALRLSGDLAKLEEADSQLRTAVQIEPRDALFHYELSLVRAQLRDWEGALAELQKATELDSSLPEVQRDLARALRKQGQGVPAALAQARYLRLMDDAPAAAALLRPVRAQNPAIDEVALALSTAEHGCRRYQPATQLVSDLLKADAQDVPALWAMFRLQRALQHYREAGEALARLEALAPGDSTVLSERADLHERLSEYREAIDVLTRLRDQEPTNPTRHYRLGYGLTLWFRDPEHSRLAEQSLRKALELKPDYLEAHYALGLLLQNNGRSREAIGHLRRALDLRPADPDALRVLARAYAQNGDRERSAETFRLLNRIQARAEEKARLQLPVDQLRDLRNSRIALARFHQSSGDFVTATRELEMLVHQHPDRVAARSLLARLYGHARRFQRQFEERKALALAQRPEPGR